MTRTVAAGVVAVLLVATSAFAQTDDRTRVFDSSMERVWTITRSALMAVGWGIEKDDKAAGFMLTDWRRLEGQDFTVYATGVKHRLRVELKSLPDGKTSVTIERHKRKEERVLWIDLGSDLPTPDHQIEAEILDAIGAAL
jgi:uncharacterized lipoprotein